MHTSWQKLVPGDKVDVIAPAAKWIDGQLSQIKTFLESWGLEPRISDAIYGPDLLCANTDEQRLKELYNALANTDSKAVWCIRGGYGCTRLLPQLAKLDIPSTTKFFIGISDITALHVFLQDQWQWPTLHASSIGQIVLNKLDNQDVQTLKKIMFGELQETTIELQAMNDAAKKATLIPAKITGGNLSIIQTSLATQWQLKTANKILFIEEINERAYQIDRMLTHIMQAKLFSEVAAVIFGDFMGGLEPNGSNLIPEVLQRFAVQLPIPVFQTTGIGHGFTNHPLPFGTMAEIIHSDMPILKIPLIYSS